MMGKAAQERGFFMCKGLVNFTKLLWVPGRKIRILCVKQRVQCIGYNMSCVPLPDGAEGAS